MITNVNLLSGLACQVLESSVNIEDILQRITPVQFEASSLEHDNFLTMGYTMTGSNLGTLKVQSKLECLGLETDDAYIHALQVDNIVLNGVTGSSYTGPVGLLATGPQGISGASTNTGTLGPTGAQTSVYPLSFLSPSQTTVSITDPSATIIRSNVAFAAGTPQDGFQKTIINGYTGTNLLSPLTNNIGSFLNGTINTMQKANNTIYIGGNFTGSNDGTIKYPYIVKWDEQNGLQQVSGPTGPNGPVYAMAYDDTSNLLYVGGSFTTWAGVTTSPPNIGSWNVSTQSFQSLGLTGLSGPTGQACISMTANSTGVLYTGWNINNQNQNLLIYENNIWKGLTGATGAGSNIPKKIVTGATHNQIYVGYDTIFNPIPRYSKIYTINPVNGSNMSLYTGSANTTMALDNTDKLYIGFREATTPASALPFEGKSYLGTYIYGNTGPSAFQEIATPISYITNDKDNNMLYMCANSYNTTLSTIINEKPYQGIISFDGSNIKNVADVNVYQNGMLTPLNSSKLLISPYPPDTFFLGGPPRTSLTNKPYIYNAAAINKDASLTITAPINYYIGQTSNSHTLYTIGDKVTMTWSSSTNSWWI